MLESWEGKPEDLTDFLIQPLDGDDATGVQLACDVVDSSSYKVRQNAVEGFMKSVLAEHHLPVPDASEPAYRSLVDAFYSRWCDLCRMALARFAGDWREAMELPFAEKPLAVEQKAAESKLSGPRLSEVFKKWADDKRQTDGDTRSTNKTISEFGATVTRFVELYGDLHVPRITRALCQEFKTALSKLPTKGEGIRGLAAPELIAKAEAEGLPTAGLATVKKQLRALSAVLNFAVQRLAAMDEEPISASGMLRSIAKAARRAETRAAEDKHYTRQDLVAIFSSPLFKGQWQPPRSDFGQALYWLPLLMVYTGARREELAQLLVSDVRKEEGSGIWYLSIAPGDGKTVKTSSSRRKVPLHADLLALGFIDYRNSLPAEGRLFPKLEEHPENGYGHAVGKAWAKYLKEVVGLESQASPSHGFRHTFKTLCREVGIEAAVSDWITGHSIAGVGADHPEARLFCSEAGVDPANQIELRLIRVELANGESEVLLTSLLDREAFPAEVFAELYHRRWGIETDFRRLKQTLTLDNFSGRSVTAVKQDFHAAQLLKNLALLMQHLLQPVIEQRHKGRKLRWKVNFTQGVSRLKNTLVELLVRHCAQGLSNVLALMAKSLSAVRSGRSFARQRKRAASRGCEGYKPTR